MKNCAIGGKIKVMRHLTKTLFACALAVLFSAQGALAQQVPFGSSSELSFKVLGNTPQMLADNPTINYSPEQKFPGYLPRISFTFKTSVKQQEWRIGEEITLLFEAGRKGYVTIINYSPNGIASILLANKPVSPGFTYAFTGEISEPGGDDYLRAVFTSSMLSYGAQKSLCEYPCAVDIKVSHVLSERWLELKVRGSRTRTIRHYPDPFYSYPRLWYRSLGTETYLYAQPAAGTILARGLELQTGSLVYTDFTEFGPAQYWLLQPGSRLEISFDVSEFPFDANNAYLLLYMSQDASSGLFAGYEAPRLRVYFNRTVVVEDYRPRHTAFYDDNPPEVISLQAFLRYGGNRIEMEVDSFSSWPVRLRRVEVRTNLEAFRTEYIWPDSSGFF